MAVAERAGCFLCRLPVSNNLREFLTIFDQDCAWRGQHGDSVRLAAVPFQGPGIVTGAGLPGDIGVIVVAEVNCRCFAGSSKK